MPEEIKQVKLDVDGDEVITTAINKLLNEFPLLNGGEIIFSTLGEDSGLGWFPTSGAIIESEVNTVKGITRQKCNYPFYVIYRSGAAMAKQKMVIKGFLDNLGKWLERQPITVNGETQKLKAYPGLTGSRKITGITRQTLAYHDNTNNGVEDWAVLIAVKYENEFRRNKNA